MSARDPAGAAAALTDLRLRLRTNGYRPVPVSGPDMPVPRSGKRPVMDGWQRICATAGDAEVRRWETAEPRCTNTGLLCGEGADNLSASDIDILDPALNARVEALAEAMLGPTPLRRIGHAPKVLRCYRADAPMRKLATPELYLPDGSKAQVEVLGTGQQFVAHGVHPDTDQPYAWPQGSPETVPLADVPIVTEAALRAFVAAAEAMIRAAGGAPKAKEKPEDDRAEGRRSDAAGKARPEHAAGPFFVEVNRRALADIEPWFRALFPKAKHQTGTGAWRVSSRDLGRDLEEDLAVHPAEGGQDFGTRESCSPIDIVVRWGGAPTPADAAFVLCEKLGIDPADLGWKESRARQRPNGHDGSTAEQAAAESESRSDSTKAGGEAEPGAGDSESATIARLAALDPLAYDRVRLAEAEALGIRVATLDDQVAARRPKPEAATGRGVSFAEVEPWPEPVVAAALLDALTAAIRRHVIMSEAAARCTALWVAHTWVYERFQHTPRLGVTSPIKRCGKSTLLEVLEATCRRTLKADSISASGTFRTVEALRPLTLLIDEADSFLGENEELRGILNSGFERSGMVVRVVEVKDEWQPVCFATFAPLALAGIGKLPGTLEDRAVPVVLARKTAAETVKKLRAGGSRAALHALRRKLARWAEDRARHLPEDPAVPEAMGDREGDVAVPLLAVADDAGGEWPKRARAALLEVFGHRNETERNAEAGTLLLADIKTIFLGTGSKQMTSQEIVEHLAAMEDRPWPEWKHGKPMTKVQLARALQPFSIRPSGSIRRGDRTAKGYEREGFEDAWTRYLPPDTPSSSPRGGF